MKTISLIPDPALSRLTRKMSFSLSDLYPVHEVIDNKNILPHIPLFIVPENETIQLPPLNLPAPIIRPDTPIVSADKVFYPLKKSLEPFQQTIKQHLPVSVIPATPELLIATLFEGTLAQNTMESILVPFTEKLLISPCYATHLAICELNEHGHAVKLISSLALKTPNSNGKPPQSVNYLPTRQ